MQVVDSVPGILNQLKKYRNDILFIWLPSLVILAFCIGLAVIAINYNERQYDVADYTNSIDIISPIIHSYDCSSQEKATDKKSCEDNQKLVMEWATSLHDLAAQNVMARATRGLLLVTASQGIATFLTLGLLIWTIRQTYLILEQSVATTTAAERTLTETGDATSATVRAAEAAENAERPYLDIELVCEFTDELPENSSFTITPKITNYGKTPAKEIRYKIYPLIPNERNWKKTPYIRDDNHIASGAFEFISAGRDGFVIGDPISKTYDTNSDQAAYKFNTLRVYDRREVTRFYITWDFIDVFETAPVTRNQYIASVHVQLARVGDKYGM